MNKTFLSLVLTSMFLTLLALVWVTTKVTNTAYGEAFPQTYTVSTTTPLVADRANLCPANLTTASSTRGVLDTIYVSGYLTQDLLIMDATTTNSALRFPVATTSNILIWLPASTGTSTIKLGVEFTRGLIVDYGTGASTTITYRCDGMNAR